MKYYKNDFRKSINAIYTDDFETFTQNTEYYKNNSYSNVYLISCVRVPICKKSNLLTYQESIINYKTIHKYRPRVFIKIEDWLNALRQLEKEQIHYFHNFIKFDFYYLQSYLIYESNIKFVTTKKLEDLKEYKINKGDFYTFVDSGNTFKNIKIILWNDYKGYICLDFRDSISLIKGSVEKIAKDLKLSIQKELNFNPDHVQNFYKSYDEAKNDTIVFNRVSSDSLIMCEAIKHYFTNPLFLNKGSTIKYTIPAISLNHFISLEIEKNNVTNNKKGYFLKVFECENKVKREHLNNYFLVDNNFYYGGVTSFIPDYQNEWLQTTYSYDINSMYPAQMIKKLPFGFPKILKNIPKKLNEDFFFFVELKGSYIKQLNRRIPPFINTKWIFLKTETELEKGLHYVYETPKNCLISTCLSLQEVNILLNKKYFESDLKVVKVLKFKSKYSTKDYINKYYSMKSEATNPTDKLVAKLFLNSLYGKFCEKPLHNNYFPREIFKQNEEDIMNNFDEEKNAFISSKQDYTYNINIKTFEYSEHTYSPVGCAITSLARSFLLQSFLDLTQENKELLIYYCDTDSMKTNMLLDHDELIDSKKLGLWKYEGCVKHFKYIRPKVYVGCNDFNNWSEDDWLTSSGISPLILKNFYLPKEINYDVGVDVLVPKKDSRNNPILIRTHKYLNNQKK